MSRPLPQGVPNAEKLQPLDNQNLNKVAAVLMGLYDDGAGNKTLMPVRVDQNGYVLTKAAP